jgi:hypothetical protein
MTPPKEVPPYVIYGFFLTGLMSSICFRVLPIANHLWPASFRPIWYTGVIGYCMFFLYRYRITLKRRRTIIDMGLLPKLKAGTLEADDREAIRYILSSLTVSKEGLNYLIIFVLSVVAIAADLALG